MRYHERRKCYGPKITGKSKPRLCHSGMIQSAEILQMTSQELNTYINELALENPVIDIVEPPTAEEQRESIEQQEWLNSFNEGELLSVPAPE